MQEPRKQPEPPVREKSVRDLELEAIYAKYDKAHPKEEEITDPDDPRYYMDSEELKAHYAEKLAEDLKTKSTPQTRRAETMEKIYGKDSAPATDEDTDDWRTADQVAFEEFQERHPELSEADWKAMNKETFILTAPDLVELREKARASGSKADVARLLERAADAYASAKLAAERRAYVQYRQTQQPHNRINDEVMKMHKFMEKRSKV